MSEPIYKRDDDKKTHQMMIVFLLLDEDTCVYVMIHGIHVDNDTDDALLDADTCM